MAHLKLLTVLVALTIIASACTGDGDESGDDAGTSDAASSDDTEAFCEGVASLGEDVSPEVEPVPVDVPPEEQMAAILDDLVIEKADEIVALTETAPDEIADEWANLSDIFQELQANGLQGLLTIDNELERLDQDRDAIDSWIRDNCDLDGLGLLEGDSQ